MKYFAVTCTSVTIPAGQGAGLLISVAVGRTSLAETAVSSGAVTVSYARPTASSVSDALSTLAPGNFAIISAPTDMTSYAAPSVSGVASTALDTLGGDSITLSGTNFGPVGTAVTVTYGPYTATGCSTTTANTEITCTTAADVVTGYAWTVNVGDQSGTSTTALSSYGPPAISRVVETGPGPMPTLGGASVVLAATRHRVQRHVRRDVGHSGALRTAHLQRDLPVHGGAVHRVKRQRPRVDWQVTVSGQTSATPFQASSTTYAAPVILTISASALNTAGGETVTLTGVNVGPMADGQATGTVTAAYGSYTTTACTITVADTSIQCTTSAGYGAGLRHRARVDGCRQWRLERAVGSHDLIRRALAQRSVVSLWVRAARRWSLSGASRSSSMAHTSAPSVRLWRYSTARATGSTRDWVHRLGRVDADHVHIAARLRRDVCVASDCWRYCHERGPVCVA